MPPPKHKPKSMLIYVCEECGLDSGWTEVDKARCRYCDRPTQLKLISKKKLTAKAMKERMKITTDRMMKNLQLAYESMTEEDKKSDDKRIDPEKQLLEIMAKAKKLRDVIHQLELNEPQKKEKAKH